MLTSEEWLLPGQTITTGCYFRATMQGDGNFVLTDHGSSLNPYWDTATSTAGGAYARMQSDGNFVIYNFLDQPLWDTSVTAPNARITMQGDGNLVETLNGTPIWDAGSGDDESPGQTNCSGSNVAKTKVWFGQDLNGGDLAGMPLHVSRASSCALACTQRSGCANFTFVPTGTFAGCWLKGTSVTMAANSSMTSGRILR